VVTVVGIEILIGCATAIQGIGIREMIRMPDAETMILGRASVGMTTDNLSIRRIRESCAGIRLAAIQGVGLILASMVC
jgi:hypothetical protein